MKFDRSLLALAAALAVAAFVPAVQAQPNERAPRGERPAHGERAAKMHEHLAQQLNLTPEQKAQFDAIHAKAAEQRRAIMSEAQQDRDAARERLKALRDDTQRQVDAILTPEQKVKADELRAKAKSFEGKRPKRLGEKMKQRRERRDVQN